MDIPSGQQRTDGDALSGGRAGPTIVLSANSSWNLLNFRTALLSGLQDAGYHLVALVPEDANAPELRRRGIEVVPIPIERSTLNPTNNLKLLGRYVAALRKLRPAAYCGFTIKPNVYGAIAARIAGVPVINNVTGLGTVFLSHSLMWQVARSLYRYAFKRSRRVFFHNQEDLKIFVDNRIVKQEQARVIPGSGVNLDEFKPLVPDPSFDGPPTFLFIGRLILQKGIREFVEAARIVRAAVPDARFRLLGNLDPGNRSSVEEAELRSWIDEGLVEHLGEHADVRPYVGEATAVVLPSYREGMSRALLEGAAMGKPLIASDVAGCRELAEEGVTGAVFEVRDARSLADAMLRIARLSPVELRKLGAGARAKVEREFGEDKVVQAYLDTLREIVR